MLKKRIVIAYLFEKYRKKTKTGQVYYLLTVTVPKNLTKLYLELTEQKIATGKSGQLLLYLFTNQNKWGSKLKVAHTYLFYYQKKNDYLHLEDWKILGDQATIKRAWRLLLPKN